MPDSIPLKGLGVSCDRVFREECTALTKGPQHTRNLAAIRKLQGQHRVTPWKSLVERDFMMFLAAELVSLTGDQFYLVAMPWLILQMTGSALAVGAVVATAAIPRAVFLLLAGALTDRLPSRSIILSSSIGRMVLVSALSVLVATSQIRLWMLFAIALGFGVGDAFYFPARNAILPNLVRKDSLLAGNAAAQTTSEIASFVGPASVGILIAALGGVGASKTAGIAAAFAVDAGTFAIAAGLIFFMRTRPRGAAAVAHQGVWESIRQGLSFAGSDPFIRTSLVLIGAGTFFLTGPLYVGLPVLASTRYSGGVSDYGWILSLFGAGSFAGIAWAALSGRSSLRSTSLSMTICPLILGVGLGLLGVLRSTPMVMAVCGVMGLAQGFLVVRFLTFLQQRTPSHALGRIMSLLMFCIVGLSPLSSGAAGLLIGFSVSWLMIGSGAALAVTVLASLLIPGMRLKTTEWDTNLAHTDHQSTVQARLTESTE